MVEVEKGFNVLDRALSRMGLMLHADSDNKRAYSITTRAKPHRKVLLYYGSNPNPLVDRGVNGYLLNCRWEDLWESVFGERAASLFVYIVGKTSKGHRTTHRVVVPNMFKGCSSIEEGLIQKDLKAEMLQMRIKR